MTAPAQPAVPRQGETHVGRPTRTPATAWAMWGVAVLAYLVAVFNRSSLGVTGVEAEARFGISAATLSLFTVLQLGVYAAMQIPTGVLIDRFGSRRLLLTGTSLMVVGQLVFATSTELITALAGRVLLGGGDALIFVSVLRLVAAWFPGRQNPVVVQLTAVVGQLGAILAAVPLIGLIHVAGWTPTFAGAAGLGALTAALIAVALRDDPRFRTQPARSGPGSARADLRAAWAAPGTRLGLWTHFSTQFPATVFSLLWGYPFLVRGQGLPPVTAGALITLLTASALVFGPLLGQQTARSPYTRSSLVLGLVGLIVALWTAVLVWPGSAPLWLLVVLMMAVGAGGPASAIGFDLARTSNPGHRLGTATGIVNVGGFVASLLVTLAIGLVLTWAVPAGTDPAAHTPGTARAFDLAFAVQYPVWALGLVQVWRHRVRTRRHLFTTDPDAFADLRAGRR